MRKSLLRDGQEASLRTGPPPGDVHGAGHQVVVLIVVALRLRVQVQLCRVTDLRVSHLLRGTQS
jgi:hypothetical protein